MTIAPKKPRQEGEAKAGPSHHRQAPPTSSAQSPHPHPQAQPKASASKTAKSSTLSLEEERANSDDEAVVETSAEESNAAFSERLGLAGLAVKEMAGDGACLFRAVADQVYGDEGMHDVVRRLTLDYMEKNRDYFSQFVTEDWREYVRRKRAPDAHGNHVEIQAIAELFARPIQVYQPSSTPLQGPPQPPQPINIFQAATADPSSQANPPIRVSYHGSVHYNSVVAPWGPATIGVGLGLPGLSGGTDRIGEATAASEREDIEAAMLEDKLRATDAEATEEKLAEQVARDSYLQFIRDEEQRLSEKGPCHSRSLTTTNANTNASANSLPTTSARAGLSSKPSSPKLDAAAAAAAAAAVSAPAAMDEAGDEGGLGQAETNSILNSFPPNIFGLSEFDVEAGNDDVLSKVLALSQQEYLDSLKSGAQEASTSKDSASNAQTHQ